MTVEVIEPGQPNPDELIATHVTDARDSFAEAHPRLDRAELDVLVHNVSSMSQPDSGWQAASSKARLVSGDPNCLTSAQTVFASSDRPERVLVQATHPVLFRDYLDNAYASEQPNGEELEKALTSWKVGGKPWLKVASLGERERRGATISRPTLAVAKFGYDANTGKVITRVGTRVIPDGRTTQVSHEMPVVDFGRILKQVVDKAAPPPNRPPR